MSSSMLKVAVIGGDGTGPEVAAEGVKVLKAVAALEGIPCELKSFDLASATADRRNPAPRRSTNRPSRLLRVGHRTSPRNLEKACLSCGSFRPVHQSAPQTVSRRRNPARWRWDIDFVVVRENTGDVRGMGGFLKRDARRGRNRRVYTRKGCERCIRWAFNTPASETRRRAHPGAKTNVLTYGHDLWWRTFQEVAQEYPDVTADYNHVDACCMWMVKSPESYDVIVTTNMFGDIITDLAGNSAGGMGVAAGGNINHDPGGTSMFEPMGGSAPKYTGTGRINPIAAISAVAMLLEQSGYEKAGARVMKAIQTVTGTKMKSQAAGKMGYTTSQVGDLVCEAL